MKNTILICLMLLNGLSVSAQNNYATLKFKLKGRALIIDAKSTSLVIEGYNGDEVIIEPDVAPQALPANNAGFTLIASALQPEDNIILYEVIKNDSAALAINLLKSSCRHVRIKIPVKTHLKISFAYGAPESKAIFRNLAGELELEGAMTEVLLDGITGPLTLSGAAKAFSTGIFQKIVLTNVQIAKNQKSTNNNLPFLNIITSYADVDISLPKETKATIQVDSPYGNFYSDLDIIPKQQPLPAVKDRYFGDLNGGGKMIVINTRNGNIFIRKQP